MTQEQKELLLKELCAKQPYEVQVFVEHDKYAQATLFGVNTKQFSIVFGGNGWSSTSNIEGRRIEQYKQLVKPYLRPMSSMTEEEREEFRSSGGVMSYSPQHDHWAISALSPDAYDWLNKNKFDSRGLIDKGLALEAPEGMYK